MPRRPEKKEILISVAGLVVGALFLGSPGIAVLERAIFGGFLVFGSIRGWCDYWRERDRYAAWRKRYRR